MVDDPSVRVEWGPDGSATSDSTGSPPPEATSSRWPILAAIAVLALVVAGAAVALGGSDAVDEPATSTAESDPPEDGETTSDVTTRVDQRMVDSATLSLSSIARVGDRWAATAEDRSEVLWSDDGLVWFEEPVTSPSGAERVATWNDEAFLVRRRTTDTGSMFDTLRARNGQWIVDTTRAPIPVGESRVLDVALAATTVVVTESPLPEPVPEVIGLIEEFAPRNLAQQTCLLRRTLVNSTDLEYALVDCDGQEIGAIDTVAMGSGDDDRLAFAESVLRERTIVYVAAPGEKLERVPLGPGQVVLELELVGDGFVAFILDPIEVIDEVGLLYSQAFEASLIRWSPEEGLQGLETPVRTSAWSANRAVTQPDGALLVSSPVGVHRAEPPFTDWELLSTGPFDPPRPGHVVETALFGDGLFVIDALDPAVVHISCCGVTWETVRLGQADVESVLAAMPDHFLIRTSAAPFVRVAR